MAVLTNYVLNPSAEGAGMSVVSNSNATVAITSLFAFSGSKSYSVTCSGTAGSTVRLALEERAPISAGQWALVRVKARCSSANTGSRTVRVNIAWYDAVPGSTFGTQLGTSFGTTVTLAPGVNFELTNSAVAPAGAKSALLVFERISGADGDLFFLDDLVIVPSDNSNGFSYFDGSSGPFSAWNGVPNAATSSFYIPEVTATPLWTSPAPRVDVLLTDVPPFLPSFTMWRTQEGRTFRVRGLVDVSSTAGIGTTQDYEAPIGVEAVYRAEFFDANGNSVGYSPAEPATLAVPDGVPGSAAWFHNPFDPASSVQVTLENGAVPQLTRAVDFETFRVPGRSAGVVLFGGARRGVEGVALNCFVDTFADANRVDALFGGYDDISIPIICVRTLPGTRLPATLFAVVGEPTQIPFNNFRGGEIVRFALQANEVAPPPESFVIALLDYERVGAGFASYAAFTATYADYTAATRDYSLGEIESPVVPDPGIPDPTPDPEPPTPPAREDLVWGTYTPDASTTGLKPGTVAEDLPAYTGSYTVTTAGTVIQNVRLDDYLLVRAANVIVRNCWVRGPATMTATTQGALINANHASCVNLLVEDCEIVPRAPGIYIDGCTGHDYTIRRSNIYQTVDGCGVFNSQAGMTTAAVNVLIEQNYIHHLAYFSPDPTHSDNRSHNDGIQIQGNSGITIRGNTIDALVSNSVGQGYPGVSPTPPAPNPYYPSVTGQAIGLTPNVSAITGVTITKNWLRAGAQSITIIPGSMGTSTTASITDNVFIKNSNPTITKGGVAAKRPVQVDPALTLSTLPSSTGADISNNRYEDGTPITVYRIVEG